MAKAIKPDGAGDKNEKFISLIIVVNTIPVTITENENVPLKVVVQKALEQTNNTGRPLEDWELKKDALVLNLSEKIKGYGLTDHQELFLSLRAGVGGTKR